MWVAMTACAVPPGTSELRPTWRGWLHAVAFLAAIPGSVLLVTRAHHASARFASVVYGCGMLFCFGTSAAYHRLARSPRVRQVMRRMDHSMIFVLIAASYTPLCLLGLPGTWGVPLLCVVSGGAALGIALKQLAFARFRLVEHALYGGLGGAVVLTTPALVRSLTAAELSLLLASGTLYALGVPVLKRGRPDPWPATFGYHEVWHAATVLAGLCHFALVGLLVL